MSDLKIEDIRYSGSSIDEFFKPKTRSAASRSGKVRIASLSELAGFQFVSSDKLVRLSQQDFWRLGEDDQGHFVERLVSDDDGPIKE